MREETAPNVKGRLKGRALNHFSPFHPGVSVTQKKEF